MPPATVALTAPNNPSLAIALYVAAMAVGLVLWFMGQRLVRPVYAISGLVLGGLGAYVFCRVLNVGGPTLVWAAVGGSAGYLLAWLLFRVWMGLSLAVLLAALAPLVLLLWAQQPLPQVATTQPAEVLTPLQEPADDAQIERIRRPLVVLTEQQRQHVLAWWDQLGGGGQKVVTVVACAFCVVGLVVGLIFPGTTAAFESALAGAVLIYVGVRGLVLTLLERDPAWLPTGARAAIITVGLITILGLAVQWTILRRPADK